MSESIVLFYTCLSEQDKMRNICHIRVIAYRRNILHYSEVIFYLVTQCSVVLSTLLIRCNSVWQLRRLSNQEGYDFISAKMLRWLWWPPCLLSNAKQEVTGPKNKAETYFHRKLWFITHRLQINSMTLTVFWSPAAAIICTSAKKKKKKSS
jgi:hypothetical protein